MVVIAAVHMRVATCTSSFLGTRMSFAIRGATKMKGAMSDDLCAGFLVDPHCATEMIRVGMCDEDRVDMTRLEVCLLQAMHDGVPGLVARESWIDHGDAVPIHHRVHVDVPEARDLDRQLHAKDILRDLGDFLLCVFLFLSFRLAHYARL